MNKKFHQSHRGFLYHQALSHFKWLSHGFSLRHVAGIAAEYSLGFNGQIPDSEAKSNRRHFLHNLGFSDTLDLRAGDMVSASLEPASVLLPLKQVHSNLIHRAGPANWTSFPLEGDGICTETPGLVLSILTADCMPILLVDKRQRIILALHSGWRGTVGKLPGHAIQFLKNEFGTNPLNCLAVIGPSIRSCCYQVGPEVRANFSCAFGSRCNLFMIPDSQSLGRFRLDLPSAARYQFAQEGLADGSIFANPPCTCCQKNRFFSYRGDAGQTGRLMTVIGIKK
jgi:YfiH family protein